MALALILTTTFFHSLPHGCFELLLGLSLCAPLPLRVPRPRRTASARYPAEATHSSVHLVSHKDPSKEQKEEEEEEEEEEELPIHITSPFSPDFRFLA